MTIMKEHAELKGSGVKVVFYELWRSEVSAHLLAEVNGPTQPVELLIFSSQR